MSGRPGLSAAGVQQLRERMVGYIERRQVPGLAMLIARGDDVDVEILGSPALNDSTPLRRDAIFRIASLSKPLAAAGAMILVEQGTIALDDPVEKYLPELANRRVLRRPDGPIDDTVPAERSITVEDLLTFRLGFGLIMAPPDSYPIQKAEAELGLMTLGPPWPPPAFDSDEWIARFATLPLMDQPGKEWRYNTGAKVLGVLIERATGVRLDAFLRAQLFEPLGMPDTAFSVPAESADRLTTAYVPDETGELRVLDPPSGGWWNTPPAMDDASGMLVSTIDDFWAFVAMLLAGVIHAGRRILSAASVSAMTCNHLTAEQRASVRIFFGEHGGWGYGMGAPGPMTGAPPIPWEFGWNAAHAAMEP